MFSQFKLKMGKGHSSATSGSKAAKKDKNTNGSTMNGNSADVAQPCSSSSSSSTTPAAAAAAAAAGSQMNRSSQPLSILKNSEGSRSNASSTSSGFPVPNAQPHLNVHYADQQVNAPPNSQSAILYQQDVHSAYSNGINARLSSSSTSSNLNRSGTLPRPLPNNYLSSSLSSNAISNNLSLNGSISLTASQNSTINQPQVPAPLNMINHQQAIYMNRAQPIYGTTTGPAVGRPVLINHAPQMIAGQPVYGHTTGQPLHNAIYGKTGTIYGTYKPYPNANGAMPIGRPVAINGLPVDCRWTRACSTLPPDDEDAGIMSEAETSSTGFRRSSKIRASLPIVRTMSKTLDRSLGLVFLQYRNETKKSLLPNEITSMDTVKALFVRSFPRQLTMSYFDDRNRVRIYIHDQSKDVFYELEDLKEIKDRCILRIYEQDQRNGVWLPAGGVTTCALPATNGIYGPGRLNESAYTDELNYFSEPEFDLQSRNATIQRKRFSAALAAPTSGYYGTVIHRPQLIYKQTNGGQPMNGPFLANGLPNGMMASPIKMTTANGHSSTLPRGSTLMNMSTYDCKVQPTPPPKPQRSFTSSLSSSQLNQPVNHSTPNGYSGASKMMAPTTLINNRALPERPYSVAGHYPFDIQSQAPVRPMFDLRQFEISSNDRMPIDVRTQHARAAAAAATAAATAAAAAANRRGADAQPMPLDSETQRLLQQINKYVESLANSVQTTNAAVATGNNVSAASPSNGHVSGTELDKLIELRRYNGEVANDIKSLRELFAASHQHLNDLLKETQSKLSEQLNMLTLPDGGEQRLRWNRMRLSREETVYRKDVRRLEQQLCDLEASVERLRANVINRRCKVNMPEVEAMALSLSRASKHLSELKASFPALQSQLKITMTKEMQVVVDEEKFLKEEPDRLENALRRCKKLTGTLVTLKRLASVQEQRSSASKGSLDKGMSTDSNDELENGKVSNMLIQVTPATPTLVNNAKPENVLDSLLDELQVFASTGKSESPSADKHAAGSATRRSLDLGKKTAPAPPPRSSSSKISDQQDQIRQLVLLQNNMGNMKCQTGDKPPPTLPKPNVIRSNSEPCGKNGATANSNACKSHTVDAHGSADKTNKECNGNNLKVQMALSISNTSLSSIDSQESVVDGSSVQRKSRQQRLEERHQELLRKQRLLQEQYSQLQQLVRGELPKNLINDLKKTSSESNLNGKPLADGIVSEDIFKMADQCANELIQNGHLTMDNQNNLTSGPSDDVTPNACAQKVYRTDIL